MEGFSVAPNQESPAFSMNHHDASALRDGEMAFLLVSDESILCAVDVMGRLVHEAGVGGSRER